MKCIDCIEKEIENPEDVEVYLIYESVKPPVKPLCQGCFDEYAYMEGAMHLDSYSIKISGVGQFEFIKRINEVLNYKSTMIQKYSDRYFAVKKLIKECDDLESINVGKIRKAIKW